MIPLAIFPGEKIKDLPVADNLHGRAVPTTGLVKNRVVFGYGVAVIN